MNRHLFNRLVLAVVIIALIVIFIPMLFSEKKKSVDAGIKKIPTMPTLPKEHAQKRPVDLHQSITSQQVSATTQPKSLSGTDQKVLKMKLMSNVNSPNVVHDEMDDAAAQKNDQAWLVHLTGFKQQKEVADAVHKLQQINLPAYTYHQADNDDLYINVGPFSQHDEALKDLNLIKEKFKLSGEIIEFDAHELTK